MPGHMVLSRDGQFVKVLESRHDVSTPGSRVQGVTPTLTCSLSPGCCLSKVTASSLTIQYCSRLSCNGNYFFALQIFMISDATRLPAGLLSLPLSDGHFGAASQEPDVDNLHR